MTLKLEQNKRVKMFILKDNGDIFRRSTNLESWGKMYRISYASSYIIEK